MKILTKPILMAYGGLAIPLAALGLPLVVYLPPFYAGPVGLGVGTGTKGVLATGVGSGIKA
jgi:hypothetical protein